DPEAQPPYSRRGYRGRSPRSSRAGPDVHVAGDVEIRLVPAVVPVPEIEVPGGVAPHRDVEADDSVARGAELLRLSGLPLHEDLELADAVSIPIPVTPAHRVHPHAVVHADATAVERVAEPDHAGVGDPRHVDVTTDEGLDRLGLAVRVMSPERVEVRQVEH